MVYNQDLIDLLRQALNYVKEEYDSEEEEPRVTIEMREIKHK